MYLSLVSYSTKHNSFSLGIYQFFVKYGMLHTCNIWWWVNMASEIKGRFPWIKWRLNSYVEQKNELRIDKSIKLCPGMCMTSLQAEAPARLQWQKQSEHITAVHCWEWRRPYTHHVHRQCCRCWRTFDPSGQRELVSNRLQEETTCGK